MKKMNLIKGIQYIPEVFINNSSKVYHHSN